MLSYSWIVPLWLIVKTCPRYIQYKIGNLIGIVFYISLAKRRKIVDINLQIAFPTLGTQERKKLTLEHFKSGGIGIVEAGIGWWASDEEIAQLGVISGLDNLDEALSEGKGVILLSAHFTTLELTGHILGLKRKLHVLYRKNENVTIERLLKRGRERHAASTIHKEDIKTMLKTLKNGGIVWFAQDQNFSGKSRVFVPFFGRLAATNPATSRLARLSGAPVVPFFAYRSNEGRYHLCIDKKLSSFPSSNDEADASCINELIEDAIRIAPEQYFWSHRRFKTQLNHGVVSPYDQGKGN